MKYGTPVAGLLGRSRRWYLPVAITPTFSPMTSNEVLLVIRTTQRSVSAPRLTVIGYCVWLKVAVAALPISSSTSCRSRCSDRTRGSRGRTGHRPPARWRRKPETGSPGLASG